MNVMALIKCPECGKEISDQAASCPNCGCPIKKPNVNSGEENSDKKIEISIKKPDIKLNKKNKGILGGIIICLVILIGVIIYTKTNITISDQENSLLLSINQIKDGLLAPDSFIAYEARTMCLDPEYSQLNYDYPIPEIYNKDMILTYIHSGGQNKSGGITDDYQIFAYDLDGNLIDTYASDDGDGIIINHTAYGEVFSEPEYYLQDVVNMMITFDGLDTVQIYNKDDISTLMNKTDGKKLRIKSTFHKYTDEEKQDALDEKTDIAVTNGDTDYLNNALNTASSDEQKKKIQEKLNQCYYNKGCDALELQEYDNARLYFSIDNNYGDTETQIKKSYYEEAKNNQNNYDPDRLIELYQKADDYSDAKDEIKRVESYKIYSQNVDKLQSEDVTLDDLKNLRPFFEEYKNTGNCQQICDYIDTMEKSPYLGKWELSNKTSEDLYDVKQYLNITPYWSGNSDRFRFTFSDTKDKFDSKSSDLKKISTDDDSEVIPNEDGTLTIKTLSSGFAIGKGMVTSSHEYTFKKIEE